MSLFLLTIIVVAFFNQQTEWWRDKLNVLRLGYFLISVFTPSFLKSASIDGIYYNPSRAISRATSF